MTEGYEDSRVAPHSLDAERAVLGAILVSPAAVSLTMEILDPEDFYSETHRVIWRAAKILFARQEEIDQLTLADELRRQEEIDRVGGRQYLFSLVEAVPTAANAKRYSEIVKNKAALRSTIEVGIKMIEAAYEEPDDPTQMLAEAEGMVYALSESLDGSRRPGLRQIAEDLPDAVREIEDALNNKNDGITGIPTGFVNIDDLTGGYQRGDLVVWAGRPSMGKMQGLEDLVVTPGGFARIGDVRRRDLVAGLDGKFHSVEGVFPQGKKAVFRLSFSDGTSARGGEEHLWFTSTRSERKRGLLGSVKTTREIMETLRTGGKENRENHRIPYAKPVQYQTMSLTVHPYLMGVYLGDGVKRSSTPAISNPEPDVREKCLDLLPGDDRMGAFDGKDWNIVGGNLTMGLREVGVLDKGSHERAIPPEYLTASVEQRTELLRGLCDSDGYVTDPGGACIEYSTTSPELARGVRELVLSLGGRATSTQKVGAYSIDGDRTECRPYSRMVLSFPPGFVPVSSKKHLEKWRGRTKKFDRAIVDVVEESVEECVCISVETEDGLYLTEDYVPTHNTAMAVNAILAAGEADAGVAFFSMEMSRNQLLVRMLSIGARMDLKALRRGTFPEEDMGILLPEVARQAQLPIYIEDNSRLTVAHMTSRLRRQQARLRASGKRLGMVVIDYLQLMEGGGGRYDNRNAEIGSISRSLKLMAKELDIVVILLSQLTRGVEGRGDKRPLLSDLRDSGSIEQDADLVFMLYRDEYYDEDTDDRGVAEVLLRKQRNGPTGDTKLAWLSMTASFGDLAKSYQQTDAPHPATKTAAQSFGARKIVPDLPGPPAHEGEWGNG